MSKIDSTNYNTQWITNGSAPVTSVFTRTGAVVAAANDYTFAQIGSKPTTLAGYGITDPVVVTSGSYVNPAWITSLIWTKITSTPTTLAGYGITDAEHSLGNPSTNGYVLSSTTAGVRSWIAPGGGGGAPTTSAYILETPDATLTKSFALSSLATGLLKNTTSTGVPTIAVAGTDYEAALGNPSANGQVLSSTTAGVRSWVAQSGGGAPGGSALTVQINNGSGGLDGLDQATSTGSHPNLSLATTGESIVSPLVGGDPIGVQFTKVLTGVDLTTAGETGRVIYTPPAGRTCLAQGFFRITRTRGSVPTTFPAIRIDNGTATSMVPGFTETSANGPVNAVVWVTATAATAFAFATNTNPVYVNVTTASNATGGHTADIIVELTLY